ncbi:hypothetical protein T440DRAFT_503501 [Plenodomus tracheiphilus IPT5]|uniref:Septin-type G domain-containing protein n=1 Tax=Plenodomus tracheiphilus IPT5 TaxID=1408161 RepID=A0A6A7BN65_9PLEO|nr:hypothetical protein T440DRAFT_503501 [Plenodomus tracheiphilus IPT5]
MRPLPGGDALPAFSAAKPRSRKSSVDHAAAPSSHVPTTFVMKRVEDLESMAATHGAGSKGKPRETTFGVQSLADTLEAAFGAESVSETVQGVVSSDSTQHATVPSRSESHSSSSGSANATESAKASPTKKSKRRLSGHVAPILFTPPNVDAPSPMPTSVMSSTPRSVSMQSLQLSDEESMVDEMASQAIASSGDEDEEEGDAETQQGASGSFPQLVIPSIQMPKRRPFTTKGKAMGKLKVLVAGQSGIGKTSLIRSIVQICEDIVHVDPLTPFSSTSQSAPSKALSRKKKAAALRICEVHASTKPFPHWWTDVDESRILRRRKSSVDIVLERNICFVDTPGVAQHSSNEETMGLIVNYVESLMYQTSSITTLEDSDVLGVVSGSGGVLVDAVLYLLPPNEDITKDIEFMQRLSLLTNVIPIIAKSDTISAQELVALKTSILARLQITSVRPFLFGKPLDDALLAVQSLPILASAQPNSDLQGEPSQYPFSTPTYPFAISSTLGSDDDVMDASLLMSPDYVQPLLPSELSTLVDQVFDPESISWLRHSAAKRFLAWRKTRLPRDPITPNPLQHPQSPTTASIGLKRTAINTSTSSSIFSVASPSGVLVPRSGSPFYASNLQSPFLASSPSLANSETAEQPGAFSLARYTNAIQGELPLSEIRIAKWATDLQRSLRNERDRFEDLQREDRAKWLLERVGEEVSRGTIVAPAGGPPRADWAVVRHGDEKEDGEAGTRYRTATGLDSRDPLGLCNFGDAFKRRGTVLVKVLGGMSVLGAVIVTVVRAFGLESSVGQSAWGWWGWVTGGNE